MSYVNFTSVAGKARSVNRDVANASRRLTSVCLIGPLGMKRGRGSGRSIPQLEQGSKRPSASEVGSPAVLSVSGLTSLDSPPGGGLSSLHQGFPMEPSLHGYLEISLQEGFACLLRAPPSSSIAGLTSCEQAHEPPPEIPSPLPLLPHLDCNASSG